MTLAAPPVQAALLLAAAALLAGCGGGDGEAASRSTAPLPERAEVLALACSGCHGRDEGAFAVLEGRPAAELEGLLIAYREDTAGTTVMHRLARGYSETDIAAISRYLAAQDPVE